MGAAGRQAGRLAGLVAGEPNPCSCHPLPVKPPTQRASPARRQHRPQLPWLLCSPEHALHGALAGCLEGGHDVGVLGRLLRQAGGGAGGAGRQGGRQEEGRNGAGEGGERASGGTRGSHGQPTSTTASQSGWARPASDTHPPTHPTHPPTSRLTVRSTTETSRVGTRKAMPVSLPFRWGSTTPTALAAPVEDGMMFWAAPAGAGGQCGAVRG